MARPRFTLNHTSTARPEAEYREAAAVHIATLRTPGGHPTVVSMAEAALSHCRFMLQTVYQTDIEGGN